MAFCKYCGKELADGEICGCSKPTVSTPFSADSVKNYTKNMNLNQFLDYIKLYFKNPNKAVENSIQSNDKTSILICAISFILCNGLVQFGLVMKASAFGYEFKGTKLFLFVFGLIYGVFGIIVPPALNMLGAALCKTNISKKTLLKENILHTTFTTIILFLGFIFGIISTGFTVLFLMISILVYVVSMNHLVVKSLSGNDTMLSKVLFGVIIIAYIFAFVILFVFELICFGNQLINVIENIFGNFINFF